MANQDAPFGFRAIGQLGSGYETQGTSKYQIQDNYTSAVYQGDAVMTGDAQADGVGTTSVAGYIAPLAPARFNGVGVFNGCFYTDPTTAKPTWKNYYPGAVNITTGTIDAFVYDSPTELFEVQGATGGTMSQSDMGNLQEMATYAAGSTVNGHSNMELSSATTTSTTAQFRLIRVSEDPNNSDTSVAHCNWVVKFNEHIYYARTIKTNA